MIRIRDLHRVQFLRFVLVGVLNTAFGYGVFALLIALRIPYPIAAFLSTTLGILFNFKTYGVLVFGSHDNRLIVRFFLVYAICYALNVAALAWGSAHHISLYLVAAVMALPMAGLSFVLNRRFVFPNTR